MSGLFFALGVLLLAHAPGGSIGGPGESGSADEKTHLLKVGDQADLSGGIKVVFQEVVSDSRCPKGTHCFWEGEAIVVLVVTDQGQSQTVKLSTLGKPRPGSGLPSSVEYSGGTLALGSLDPHPVGGQPPPEKDDYRLTLKVN